MQIDIITPCTRGENLDTINNSLVEGMGDISYKWIVVIDGKNPGDLGIQLQLYPNTKYYAHSSENFRLGLSGNPQRNFGISKAKGDYLYFLDDDNILHPSLFKNTRDLLDGDKAVIVNQVWPNGQIRLTAHPTHMDVGGIDTAQGIIPRYMLEDIRWDVHNYCADGVLYNQIFKRFPDKFIFVNSGLSFYNYLRV